VRRLSTQRRVSIATVLRAYEVLENRGLIEARPNAGYYVRHRSPSAGERPSPTRRCAAAGRRQRAGAGSPGFAPPGVVSFAPPAPVRTIADRKLQRLISSIARRNAVAHALRAAAGQ